MPRYILEDVRETLRPTMLIEGGEVRIGLRDMADGIHNTIVSLTVDGRLRLHRLNRAWAERAGIQCDKEGKIQIV